MVRSAFFVSLLFTGLQWAEAKYIVPGGRWRDTNGDLVNAHAGCVTLDKDTGKFWLFGEYKTEGQTEGGGVSVYSSDDLATWQSHGLALAPVEGHEIISSHHIIQRPKVVYSEVSEEYHVSSIPVTNRSYLATAMKLILVATDVVARR